MGGEKIRKQIFGDRPLHAPGGDEVVNAKPEICPSSGVHSTLRCGRFVTKPQTLPFVIDRAPLVMWLVVDADKHIIKMPAPVRTVARGSSSSSSPKCRRARL